MRVGMRRGYLAAVSQAPIQAGRDHHGNMHTFIHHFVPVLFSILGAIQHIILPDDSGNHSKFELFVRKLVP